MLRTHSVWPLLFCMAALISIPGSASGNAAEALPQPGHTAHGGSKPQIESSILAARRYAAFWNTGDEDYARAALSKGFMDRTLPAGRVQGIEGPIQASKAFRTAVPDLRVEIMQLVPAGDRISVHYRFTGHFTGRFGEVVGNGQAIAFEAFDVYRIENGQIAENWHLEDNLTLLKQMGIVK
jgi:predicted ester cyclase